MLNIKTDVDGVLSHFCITYLEILEKTSGIKKELKDITSFNFQKCVATPEQDKAVWDYINNTPGVVYNIPHMEGALQGLSEVRKLGHVKALTSPHLGPTWFYERAMSLIDNFGFTKKEIIFCSDRRKFLGIF
jgi:5'(3')-deoxyribonucleotidase